MKIKHKILLALLMTTKHELTSLELYEEMTIDQQSKYLDIYDVGKILGYLRSKEWVANGETKYKERRAILTWLITPKGVDAMSENEAVYDLKESVVPPSISDEDLTLELTLQNIRDLFAQRPVIEPRVIIDLDKKVDTLARLGAIMSDDIGRILGLIIKDLESV